MTRQKKPAVEPYSVKTSDGRRLVYVSRRDGSCSVLDAETEASEICALIEAAAKQRGRGRVWIRDKHRELGLSASCRRQVGFGRVRPQLRGKEAP